MTVEECNTALYEKLFESQEQLRRLAIEPAPGGDFEPCV